MDDQQPRAYFEYLRDPNIPIPFMTVRDRQRVAEQMILVHQQVAEGGDDQNHENMQIDQNPAAHNYEQNAMSDNEERYSESSSARSNHSNNVEENISDEEHGEIYDGLLVANEILDELPRDAGNPNVFQNDIEDDVDEENEREEFYDAVDVQLNVIIDNEGAIQRDEERENIFPGVTLTREESDLLIMSYLIRHNLSDIALENLLELINCHLPEKLNLSKYRFLKKFPNIADFKTFYYCPDCFVLLNFTNAQYTACASCHQFFLQNSLKRNGHFFLHIPLKTQLKNLFSSPLFYELNRNHAEDETLSDITSGSVYKFLREQNIISNSDISLQWNADGVQTFKSSKVSMCPIQVSVNELKHSVRKENILLAGLWAATEKPDLNLFFKPFVDELKDLHDNGFECQPPNLDEPVTIKVHTILAPVDSVERCACQNMHQYNGKHGCTFCLKLGDPIPVGRGFARIYSGEVGTQRTVDQHTRDAIQAEETQTVVNGVKGVSVLMLLPVFNIIKSFPPEYMHSVLLGVVKLFLSNWIDSKNSHKLWYFGTKTQILDDRLALILPPSEITRTPQSVKNLKQWKASEFKNFLLYYSLPALKDILPSIFYKHWSLFVYAINAFNSDSIGVQTYEKASRAITQFVYRTERLYGPEFMKYNVHLMLHIPQSVKDFGALWAWSAFPYESNNFVLRNMLHGSQAILQQICKSYLRYQTVKYMDTFNRPHCSVEGKSLYSNMMGKYKNRTGQRAIDQNHLILFGGGKIISYLPLVEKLSIEALVQERIEDCATNYERFIYNNVLYHASTYDRMWKRNNSIVALTAGRFMRITGILSVITLTGVNKYIIIGNSFEILNDVLCSYNGISSSSYSTPVRETNNILTCLPQDVCNKCILLPCNNTTYIMKLVNRMETD